MEDNKKLSSNLLGMKFMRRALIAAPAAAAIPSTPGHWVTGNAKSQRFHVETVPSFTEFDSMLSSGRVSFQQFNPEIERSQGATIEAARSKQSMAVNEAIAHKTAQADAEFAQRLVFSQVIQSISLSVCAFLWAA